MFHNAIRDFHADVTKRMYFMSQDSIDNSLYENCFFQSSLLCLTDEIICKICILLKCYLYITGYPYLVFLASGCYFFYIYTRFTLNNQWNMQFKILHSEYKVPGVISLCTYVISCNLNVYTYLETMIIKY